MKNYLKITKRLFFWAIELTIINWGFIYLSSAITPFPYDEIGALNFLPLIFLSLFFCLLVISFGIKTLKSGEKKAKYFIIISGALALLNMFPYVLILINVINNSFYSYVY